MNALYIGFARQDTFLTNNIQGIIDTEYERVVEEQRQEIITNAEILNAARQTANYFVFSCDPSDDWLADLGRTDESTQIVRTVWYAYGNPTTISPYNTFDGNSDREFKVGFKDSKIAATERESSNDAPWTDGDLGWDDFINFVPADDPWRLYGREKSGTGCKIEKLFNDGVPFTASYTWTFDVYGAYDTYGAVSAARSEAVRSGKPKLGAVVGAPESGGYALEPQHRGSYTQTASASNAEEWRNIRSDSIREGDPPTRNNAPRPYPTETKGFLTENEKDGEPGQPDASGNPLMSKWFLVNLKATITFAGTQRKIDHWEAIQGDEGFYFQTNLGWPNNTGYGVYDPSIVPNG
jgi:hypothetical protein